MINKGLKNNTGTSEILDPRRVASSISSPPSAQHVYGPGLSADNSGNAKGISIMSYFLSVLPLFFSPPSGPVPWRQTSQWTVVAVLRSAQNTLNYSSKHLLTCDVISSHIVESVFRKLTTSPFAQTNSRYTVDTHLSTTMHL